MNRRERGDGTVYQRGVVWWVKYYHRGRAYRESSGSTDRRIAAKLLRKRLLRSPLTNTPPTPRRSASMTWRKWSKTTTA